MYSYSQILCQESVKQAISMLYYSDACDPRYALAPCNPQNITKMLGINFNDIHVETDEEFDNLMIDLPKRCPRACTETSFEARETHSNDPFYFNR